MNIALIPSAGRGERLEKALSMKKQFFPLKDHKEMFLVTAELFTSRSDFEAVYLIISKEDAEKYASALKREGLSSKVKLVFGSSSREESVYEGLKAIENDFKAQDPKNITVFIHDGDRPFLSKAMLDQLISCSAEEEAIIPCCQINDSIYDMDKGSYPQRKSLRAVQTPQVFRLDKIMKAFDKNISSLSSFTDEGSLIIKEGGRLFVFEGDPENIKISDVKSLKEGKERLSHGS